MGVSLKILNSGIIPKTFTHASQPLISIYDINNLCALHTKYYMGLNARKTVFGDGEQ